MTRSRYRIFNAGFPTQSTFWLVAGLSTAGSRIATGLPTLRNVVQSVTVWNGLPSHTASDPAILDFLFEHDGSFYDRATGLEFDINRVYDPTLQRWLQQDPLGLAAGPNDYEYCSDSPTNLTDPTGEKGSKIGTQVFDNGKTVDKPCAVHKDDQGRERDVDADTLLASLLSRIRG